MRPTKIHLISPCCPQAQYSLTAQNLCLKHHSFIHSFIHLKVYNMMSEEVMVWCCDLRCACFVCCRLCWSLWWESNCLSGRCEGEVFSSDVQILPYSVTAATALLTPHSPALVKLGQVRGQVFLTSGHFLFNQVTRNPGILLRRREVYSSRGLLQKTYDTELENTTTTSFTTVLWTFYGRLLAVYWLFYYCEPTGYCDLFSISAVGIISSSKHVAEAVVYYFSCIMIRCIVMVVSAVW